MTSPGQEGPTYASEGILNFQANLCNSVHGLNQFESQANKMKLFLRVNLVTAAVKRTVGRRNNQQAEACWQQGREGGEAGRNAREVQMQSRAVKMHRARLQLEPNRCDF